MRDSPTLGRITHTLNLNHAAKPVASFEALTTPISSNKHTYTPTFRS